MRSGGGEEILQVLLILEFVAVHLIQMGGIEGWSGVFTHHCGYCKITILGPVSGVQIATFCSFTTLEWSSYVAGSLSPVISHHRVLRLLG